MSGNLIPTAGTDVVANVASILGSSGDDLGTPIVLGEKKPEPKQVQQVAKRQADPLAISRIDPADKSAVARYIENANGLPPIPPTFQQDWQMVTTEIQARWDLGQEHLANSLALENAGRYGEAALAQNRAAAVWADAGEYRKTLANMQALVSAHQIREFQLWLVQRFSWLLSSRHYENCIEWCMNEYGVTREQAEFAPPDDIVAAATAYEAHVRASGQRLAPPVPRGKKPSKQREGGLSQGDRVALISEMLRDI